MVIAKSLGKTKLIVPDQGGWITYFQYGKKLKFDLKELNTHYGVIDLKNLEDSVDKNSVVLYGQPNEGLVIVKITPEIRNKTQRLLDLME